MIILTLAAIWVVLVSLTWMFVIPVLRRGPSRFAARGLLWHAVRVYSRLMHRPTFVGLDSIRDDADAGPFVVVSNHTCSIDPVLIQAGCRFSIRWLMAAEMMTSDLDWLWRFERIVPVARDGSDTGPLREAIRHVKGGETIGIFPEGRLVWPPGHVWPFAPGVGLVVARTRVPVLLCLVTGTPRTTSMGKALVTRSRARVEFLELIDFGDQRDAHHITETLRQKIVDASGWPTAEEGPKPERSSDPFL